MPFYIKFLKSVNFVNLSNPLKSEKLRLELSVCEEELHREKQIANEQISELSNELRSCVTKYDEIISKMEQEFIEKLSQNIEQQKDRTITTEVTLMDEIKKQDEDLDFLRKTNRELEKKLEFMKKQKENNENDYQRKMTILENRETSDEIKKIKEKYDKILVENKEKFASKEEYIVNLEKSKALDRKNILHLEGENKKFQEINLRLQGKLKLLESQQQESEEKLTNMIKDYETRFIELERSYEDEKNANFHKDELFGRNAELFKEKCENSPSHNPHRNLSNELGSFNLGRPSLLMNPGSIQFNLIDEEHLKERGSRGFSIFRKRSFSKFKREPENNAESIGEITNENVKSIEEIEENKEENEENGKDGENGEKNEVIRQEGQGMEEKQKEIQKEFGEICEENQGFREIIDKLQGEIQGFLKAFKEKDEEIERFKVENLQIKEECEKIQKKWLGELEKKRNRELETVKNEQNFRKRSIDLLIKTPGIGIGGISEGDLNKIVKEKKELEADYWRLKRETIDEKVFLEEEMKKLEEKIEESNGKFVKALNERDYFEQQWKEEANLAKMDKRVVKEKKISRWLMCGGCK